MSFTSPTSPGNPVGRRRPAVAAALLLAAVTGVIAQEPAGQPPQPTFKSGVQLVEVDVRVFDRDGRFVTDLTREDFELLEEGAPQSIDALLLVGAAGPAAAAPTGDPAAALPSQPGTPPNPSGRQAWIFFFDLNHLTPGGGFDRARSAVEQFIRDRFREGDMAGVLAGDRMINNRLTSIREELLGAVKQVKPRSDARSRFIEMTREWPRLQNEEEALRVARGEREPLQRAITRACGDEPEQCQIADSAVRQKGQKIGAEIQRSSIATLTSLNALASGLAKMPGPKTVVFLSDGFVAQESEATLRNVVGQITRAGARVYAIDVRGLNRFGGSSLIDQGQVDDPAGPAVTSDSLADGPNSVSVDTGGLMIRNENNIGRALDTVAEDSGRYYVLAYQPANGNFDGKYREIQVRVKRDGVRVRARRGYLALPTSRMLLPQPIKPPGDPAPSATTGTDVPPPAPVANLPERLPETPASPAPAPAPAPVAPSPATVAPVPVGGGESPAVRLRPDTEGRVRALSSRETAAASEAAKRGWDAYQRGDVEAAEVAFTSAVESPDARPWVHYALGMSHAALGRVNEAIASWERVRAAVPDFEPVYMDLADTYAAKADLTSALAIVRDAEKRWPNSADVQSAIGVIHVRRGAMDDGIRALEKVTTITPGDDLAWLNLGRAYALRFHRGRRYVTSQRRWTAPEGDRTKAIEALQKCVEIAGPYADAAKAEMSVLEWSK
jgi:VWFA-related protein